MKEYLLEELLEIKNGKDHQNLSDGNIPVYGSGGLMRYVDKTLYDDESILLPRKGSLQNIQYTKKPFWTVDTLYYSIVNKGKVVPYFLYYYLKRLDLSKLNSGTGVPSMTFGAYYGIKVKLPELKTQQNISKFLSDLDNKIELNNKINAELEAMAKTFYDYWFVQFDFPDANGKPYKTSGGKMVWNEELKREIPEGWEIQTIDEYAEVKKGDLITSKDSKEGNVKVIAAGISYAYTHSISNREKNTITVSGSGANAGFINFWREPIFASDCITIRGHNDIITLMILYHLRLLQNYIFSQATGSAQPHVYPSDIKILKYIVPTNDLIEIFGKIAIQSNDKITNNLQENQKLASLRDWLLPMLMNGQIKIK